MNALKQALNAEHFVCVLEVIPQSAEKHWATVSPLVQRGHLANWPLVPALADRVGPHTEVSPLQGSERLGYPHASLLHFSGKDREQTDLLNLIDAMQAHGLKQLLILTGDRLAGHQPNQAPVRYLESVPALQIARKHGPDWLLGAALNPFKYREEEGGAQYLKAQKKLSAGADFLTLQLGYDAEKYREAMTWMQAQAAPKPLLACVMRLTHKRAEVLQSVPGIVITPSMHQLLAHEEQQSPAYASARSLDRLALQILGLQWLGYAGIHLSGVHQLDELLALEACLADWQQRIGSLEEWQIHWNASWQHPSVPQVTFSPEPTAWALGQSTVSASRWEQRRYRLFSAMHRLFFDRHSGLSKVFGWCVSRPFWQSGKAAKALHLAERSIKRPLLGCDTCGSCRLQDTLYVCPETCPKGLANGPCGGTSLNRCEFGDRECIHSVKYRIAKSTQQLPVLSERLIPCVDMHNRHTSSWPQWFAASEKQPPRAP